MYVRVIAYNYQNANSQVNCLSSAVAIKRLWKYYSKRSRLRIMVWFNSICRETTSSIVHIRTVRMHCLNSTNTILNVSKGRYALNRFQPKCRQFIHSNTRKHDVVIIISLISRWTVVIVFVLYSIPTKLSATF